MWAHWTVNTWQDVAFKIHVCWRFLSVQFHNKNEFCKQQILSCSYQCNTESRSILWQKQNWQQNFLSCAGQSTVATKTKHSHSSEQPCSTQQCKSDNSLTSVKVRYARCSIILHYLTLGRELSMTDLLLSTEKSSPGSSMMVVNYQLCLLFSAWEYLGRYFHGRKRCKVFETNCNVSRKVTKTESCWL